MRRRAARRRRRPCTRAARPSRPRAPPSAASGVVPAWVSQEVVEVSFGAEPAAHAEDVCRNGRGIDRDEAPGPVPEVAGVAQEIVHLKRLARFEAELVEGDVDPAAL